MADQNLALSLDLFHDAVIDALAQQFPIFKTVEDYPQDRKLRAVPGLYIDLEEMEEANKEDPGTGQQALNLRLCARIVLPAELPKVGRAARCLAAGVAAFVHLNRFGMPVNAAELVGAYPDHFSPELDQYVVWRVDWQQVGHFGDSVWTCWDQGTVPSEIWLAYSENGVNAPNDAFVQIVPAT